MEFLLYINLDKENSFRILDIDTDMTANFLRHHADDFEIYRVGEHENEELPDETIEQFVSEANKYAHDEYPTLAEDHDAEDIPKVLIEQIGNLAYSSKVNDIDDLSALSGIEKSRLIELGLEYDTVPDEKALQSMTVAELAKLAKAFNKDIVLM